MSIDAHKRVMDNHEAEVAVRATGCCQQSASCDATCRYFGYAQYIREVKERQNDTNRL